MRLLAAILILSIIYVAQNKLYRKYWNKNLDADLRFSRDYIECGENAELIEVISNDKALPLPVFHMKFSVDKSLRFDDHTNSSVTDFYHKNEVFSILGHQKLTRRLTFTGTARGVMAVNNASISVHDFFMTKTYAMAICSQDTIYVFPPKLNTDRFHIFFKGIMGELEARRSMVEDSLTFRGIREYQPFDPYRSINWKQSAKARELMVNVFGYTTDSRVRIMLNLDNDYMIEKDKLLEEAISLTSSIARRFLDRGISVSVITNGTSSDRNALPDSGEGAEKKHGITIDRILSEISGSLQKDVFLDYLRNEIKVGRKDTLYLIISPYAKQDMLALLDRMEELDMAVQLLVPYYDEYPFVSNRHYATGWEVPLNL